jgi:hypothetical protein
VRASEPVRVTITVVAADAEVETGAEQGGDENESNGD